MILFNHFFIGSDMGKAVDQIDFLTQLLRRQGASLLCILQGLFNIPDPVKGHRPVMNHSRKGFSAALIFLTQNQRLIAWRQFFDLLLTKGKGGEVLHLFLDHIQFQLLLKTH